MCYYRAMLHAELRGKSAPEDQYGEDALTSTVFGTLFTAGDAGASALSAWLARARPADAATPAWWPIRGVRDYWFWPRLREAEPDLVIELDGALVIVEAKFLSSKSGGGGPPAELAGSDDEGARVSDQLLREWRSLLPRAERGALRGVGGHGLLEASARCERRALVYLVKRSHAVKAERELAASLEAAGAMLPRPTLYLLHWEHLDEVLTAAALAGPVPRWHRELRAFLGHRGISAFRGFGTAIRRDEVADLAPILAWRRSWRPACRLPLAFQKADDPLLMSLARRVPRFEIRR